MQINKYQKILQEATNKVMLFPNVSNQGEKLYVKYLSNIKLPSSYPFRSSREVEKNTLINTHQIAHQQQKQSLILSQNKWPQSCIGLVLCQHHQNNQTFYVYGTGTLIHKNIVLTSAQNVYCRRLNKQYINIKFITGVNGNMCSRINVVKQVHYPNQYTMQEYQNYDFAVLQLYIQLSDIFGYVGWKTACEPAQNKLITYGYINDNQKGTFTLRQITKNQKSKQNWIRCSGSGVLLKGLTDKYYIVGLHNRSQGRVYSVLSQRIRNMVNQWTHFTEIKLYYNNIGKQGFGSMYLLRYEQELISFIGQKKALQNLAKTNSIFNYTCQTKYQSCNRIEKNIEIVAYCQLIKQTTLINQFYILIFLFTQIFKNNKIQVQ